MPSTRSSPGGLPINSEPLPDDVKRTLAQLTGLRLDGSEWRKAEEFLRARVGPSFPSLGAYWASLSGQEAEREADALAAQFTPGETFFFRDHGQFDLLRFQLLPELIAARRRERTLRLWSAGCASGEEAYSLAMLVDMALPERRTWRISILGSDIKPEALAQARRARYGEWSFRSVPASLKARYFRQVEGGEWALEEDIRQLVSFRSGNLIQDCLPNGAFRDMDLILCRNVFIYFSPEAVRLVAGKLAACLAPGGYLLTGHTELVGQPVAGLDSRLFTESLVYRRPAVSRPSPPPPPTVSAAFPPAPAPAAPPPPRMSAQALADRGDYPAAEAACREELAADSLRPGPHFLLAQLAQLRGDYREAEAELGRTLYLAPGHVAAYLELAALHERAGEAGRARARRRAALDLLRRLPSDAPVEPFEASAGQLAAWLMATESLG